MRARHGKRSPLPQTAAEIVAWNFGKHGRAAGHSVPPAVVLGASESATLSSMDDAERQSLVTLGANLFWEWADKGYQSTTQ